MNQVKRNLGQGNEKDTLNVKTPKYDRDFTYENGMIIKWQWCNVVIGHRPGKKLYIKKGNQYEFYKNEGGPAIWGYRLVKKGEWTPEEFQNKQMWDGFLHKGENRRAILKELMK